MAWSVPHILSLNQLSEAGLKKILKKAELSNGIQLKGRIYSYFRSSVFLLDRAFITLFCPLATFNDWCIDRSNKLKFCKFYLFVIQAWCVDPGQ